MEQLDISSLINAGMNADGNSGEIGNIHGHYDLVCTDSDGNVLWDGEIDNVVVYTGKNAILQAGLVGPANSFLGLIGSGTVTAVSDTMTTHAGWIEAGGAQSPVYGTTRPTLTLSAPVSGVVNNNGTNACNFVFTNAGTVNGAFAAIGTNAGTVDNTTGTLISAGTLTNGGGTFTPQPVIAGNTVTMTYTLTLA